jgi:hypothetical protein
MIIRVNIVFELGVKTEAIKNNYCVFVHFFYLTFDPAFLVVKGAKVAGTHVLLETGMIPLFLDNDKEQTRHSNQGEYDNQVNNHLPSSLLSS